MAETNQGWFDRFSLLHLGSGFILGKFDLPFITTLGLGLVFELLEAGAKKTTPSIFPNASQDSTVNIIGDTISVMAGWVVGRYV